jgi:predicted dehydrogenase
MTKVRWGVLGVASIATRKVIPAMQRGERSTIAAIASRELGKAQAAAQSMGIPKAYGSYEEMLNDPEIEAIYNPLPNHMHVPWSVKAAEAGKHVLCEKPVSMDAAEAKILLDARNRTGVKIGEAFMVRTHPQWLRTRELIREGRIGELRAIDTHFSYFNTDPQNPRNIHEWGGGALLDIGCYPINLSRFVLGEEPTRVMGLVERDPVFQTDRVTSGIMDFPTCQSVFVCSTQMNYSQRMIFTGTKVRLQVEIPFNAPIDRPCRLLIDDGRDLFGGGASVETIPTCDQYTVQGDAFSRAIRENGEVPVPLEDAIRNMAVIDAIFRSGESGRWEEPLA